MTYELSDGTQAISRAALDSGCDFFAGYPITPSSGILQYMMKALPGLGGVAIQGEDEISSIGFCLAASMTGRRVMTATSGPGMSLYSENIGLAIMGEVPLVILNVQRLGPATGGATTSAEGDVQFVQWVTSGGLPMVVLSPVDIPTSYSLTMQAFRIAERYRVPVILNTTKELVLTTESVNIKDYKRVPVKSRRRFTAKGVYKPYAIKNSADVPAFLPIGADTQVRFTTSTHDECAILTKDPAKAKKSIDHLRDKIEKNVDDLILYEQDKQRGAHYLMIAYGQAARAAKSACMQLRAKGIKVNLLTLFTLWPVPEWVIRQAAKNIKKIIIPEHNTGLYAREVKRVVPDKKIIQINRMDGTMITSEEIMGAL